MKRVRGKFIYKADKPIYNVAISPDHQRIALLISQEEITHPSADLVVLDREGNGLFEKENASYLLIAMEFGVSIRCSGTTMLRYRCIAT